MLLKFYLLQSMADIPACSADIVRQIQEQYEQRNQRLNLALTQRNRLIEQRERELREWKAFYDGERQKIDALTAEQKNCIQLRNECTRLGQETQRTTRILDDNKRLITQLQNRLLTRTGEFEDKFHAVSDELNETKRKLESVERRNAELKRDSDKFESLLRERTNILNERIRQIPVSQARIALVEETNRQCNEALENEKKRHDEETAQLRAQINAQRDQIRSLTARLNQCNKNDNSRMQQLQSELDNCRSNIRPLIPEIKEASPLSPRTVAKIGLTTSTMDPSGKNRQVIAAPFPIQSMGPPTTANADIKHSMPPLVTIEDREGNLLPTSDISPTPFVTPSALPAGIGGSNIRTSPRPVSETFLTDIGDSDIPGAPTPPRSIPNAPPPFSRLGDI